VSRPRQTINRDVSDLASTKPHEHKKTVKRLYQAGGLLEAVEGLELVDHVEVSGVDKPNRLSGVDRLHQVAVEEGVLHVEMVGRPVPG
jgi:dihydroxyacid dehydratase/phosphogluconate dehydratase